MPSTPAAATVSGIGIHRLAARDVDALALGVIDAEVVERLLETEISFRRLALRAILDALREQPAATDPLAPVDQAWDLLVEVEQRDPAAVRAVIDRPFAGAWATRLLRRLRGRLHHDVPLWVEVGYLHAMAAAAAVRAGEPVELAVPAHRGVVHLPSLGHARLPFWEIWETAVVRGTGGDAEVIGSAGRVRVDRGDGGGAPTRDVAVWHPTRAARAVGVVIEDADPYRLVDRVVPPVRLADADVARWEGRLAGAWQVLRDGHPQLAAGVDAAVSAVVPLPVAQRFRSFSATSGDAVGSVELTEPPDPVDGAATLAHEFRHTVLSAVLHLCDLIDPQAPPVLRYAPWRDDPRPPHGVLHGIYAFFGVTEFWRRQRRLAVGADAMLAHFEFALWRGEVLDTATEMLRTGPLTALGRRFVTGIRTTVQGWLPEPVPVETRRLAELATADSRALWRIHHLEPDSAAVERLAAAWAAGAAAPPAAVPARLVPDPGARALDTRASLARLWLADRDAFRRTERAGPGREYRGASAADCALVAGDRARARQGYAADVQRDGDDRRALVGLGLAIGDGEPAGWTLLRRPELVRAVAAAAVDRGGEAPDPSALAAWLLPASVQPDEPDASGQPDVSGQRLARDDAAAAARLIRE
ncbi:HEXXH motif domain-containing protein [Frankia sp. ACN1ag]|uniref:HEXXH motif domain-containing protein n=1 Tax=Frankia sp. ACN1ag TaxID=102891 RepID=UPI0009F8EDA0|nr:HEXXH motif domain-containing protein [Frankia sp. ACN1ag]